MKKQEQRELAIEAYTLGCKDVSSGKGGLKTFLESRGLSEELEVGKWYWNGNGKTLLCCQSETGGGYGFCSDGRWSNIIGDVYRERYELATNEEVEAALIAEAKKRGIWETPINDCNGFNERNKGSYRANFNGKLNLWSSVGCVFKNGEWATLIEPKPTQMTIAQLEKLTGIEKLEIVK